MAQNSDSAATYLYLANSGGHKLTLAYVSRQRVLRHRIIARGVRSEQLLKALVVFGATRSQVAGYVVALGPGSFSQVRLICSLVNALAYATGKPVASLLLQPRLSDLPRKIRELTWQRQVRPRYQGPGVG